MGRVGVLGKERSPLYARGAEGKHAARACAIG